MVQQAREWESSGEYARAVECYLKVNNQLTSDTEMMMKCWKKVSTIFTMCIRTDWPEQTDETPHKSLHHATHL